MYNVQKYKEILDYCKDDLDCLNNEMKSLLFQNETFLNKDLSAFLFAKSKKLRPVLLFLVKDFFNIKTNDGIIKLALATELLHAATLIHDDIIDDAEKRRNLKTFHKKFNSKIATLAGDFLLSLSLNLLSKLNSPEIFAHFSNNTLQICKGEIDQFFNKNNIISIEKYLEKSKNKTSSLFLAGVKSLFCLIDVPCEEKIALINFSEKFSLAFQIYDDIENFKNENKDKISSDIQNGIFTLPYLYLAQQNFYGKMDYKNLTAEHLNEALNYSRDFLNSILNNALLDLEKTQKKKDMLTKLVEVFQDMQGL